MWRNSDPRYIARITEIYTTVLFASVLLTTFFLSPSMIHSELPRKQISVAFTKITSVLFVCKCPSLVTKFAKNYLNCEQKMTKLVSSWVQNINSDISDISEMKMHTCEQKIIASLSFSTAGFSLTVYNFLKIQWTQKKMSKADLKQNEIGRSGPNLGLLTWSQEAVKSILQQPPTLRNRLVQKMVRFVPSDQQLCTRTKSVK